MLYRLDERRRRKRFTHPCCYSCIYHYIKGKFLRKRTWAVIRKWWGAERSLKARAFLYLLCHSPGKNHIMSSNSIKDRKHLSIVFFLFLSSIFFLSHLSERCWERITDLVEVKTRKSFYLGEKCNTFMLSTVLSPYFLFLSFSFSCSDVSCSDTCTFTEGLKRCYTW